MKVWTEAERQELGKNPNILKVTGKNVAFRPEFKLRAIAAYDDGIAAEDFFKDAGIPVDLFPGKYARFCVKRWRLKSIVDGSASFREDKRGKGSKGRPRKDGLDSYSKDDLKAIIEFQARFIDELKKMNALAKRKSSKD